ncbi:MAG: hypothetical protein R3E82_14080 [Pseudomonadales bacterium]|nr:hypothetical protein [Pseudomonadales bacterium]
MGRDYRFLIGRQFLADGGLYFVQGLSTGDSPPVIEAGLSPDDPPSHRFSIGDVIRGLLVEEEIELFNPNYLSAR